MTTHIATRANARASLTTVRFVGPLLSQQKVSEVTQRWASGVESTGRRPSKRASEAAEACRGGEIELTCRAEPQLLPRRSCRARQDTTTVKVTERSASCLVIV